MKAHVSLLALSVLCQPLVGLAPAAWAQAAPPSVSAPAPPAAVAAPPPPGTSVDTRAPTTVNTSPPPPAAVAPAPVAEAARFGAPRVRDAHHDRLLFAPTAETNPEGSFTVTSYYIVVLQLGYALSDRTQLSVTALPPIGDEHVLPGDISLKTVLWREPRVSVAAIASASGVLGLEEFSGFLGRAGGVATFCVDPDACRLELSLGTSLALAGPASVLFSGAGGSFRAGRYVSIVAELDSLIPLGEAVGEANGVLGGVAVRLSGRAFGVDLGILQAGKARESPSGMLPFLAATYRYVP